MLFSFVVFLSGYFWAVRALLNSGNDESEDEVISLLSSKPFLLLTICILKNTNSCYLNAYCEKIIELSFYKIFSFYYQNNSMV